MMDNQRGANNKFMARDFLRARWVWLMLAAGAVLFAVIALVVVLPFFWSTTTPGETQARQACQADIQQQLADDGPIKFEGETAKASDDDNTWRISGTAVLSGMGTEPREYECVYTANELVDVEVQTP